MTTIKELAGTAVAGTLYGIGVGPGDTRYLTLRAAGLIASVEIIAYFAKKGRQGNARRVVSPLIMAERTELKFEYPVTTEVPVDHPDYRRSIADFYVTTAETLGDHLNQGKSIGLLSEGDPFFYGSFMHMWRRLESKFPVEVVPGVTGMSGCWTSANTPITWGDDVLTVLPGTLDEAQLTSQLKATDAAVIMKVGRNLEKIRRAVLSADLMNRALYVERGTMKDERILPFCDYNEPTAPYFAMVIIPGEGRRL